LSNVTPNLGLQKPLENEYYDINVQNSNMDKIDAAIGKIKLPDGTLNQKGIVQLSSETDSTSETVAATAKAVKTVNDAVNVHKSDNVQHITSAERTAWNAKETPTGAQAKATAAETNAKNYVDVKAWQKYKLTDDSGVAAVVSDLNLADNTGFYMGSNMLNAPSVDWHYVEVIRHNNIWCVQKAYNFNRTSFYMRQKQNGTWGAWSADLFQSVSDGKNAIAGAITGKGVPASGDDAFAVLASKIGQISTKAPEAAGSGQITKPDNEGRNVTISGLAFTPRIIIVGGPAGVSSYDVVKTMATKFNDDGSMNLDWRYQIGTGQYGQIESRQSNGFVFSLHGNSTSPSPETIKYTWWACA